MDEKIQKRIKEEMDILAAIKTKMSIHEEWGQEDARMIYTTIRMNKKSEESEIRPKNKKKQNKLKLGQRYDFKEMPGNATNKQLEFIQFLRKKAKEGELKISVSVENVPKMKYEDADREIKRLKEKLGWPDKEE